MISGRTLRLLLPRPIRRFPADLAGLVALTLLVNVAVFVPIVRETPLRVPVGLVFVLVAPGYAIVSAAFPRATASLVTGGDRRDEARTAQHGGSWIERLVLAVVLSVAIGPLIGLVLNVTPWGIRLAPFLLATTGFVLASSTIAAVRRWQLPPAERFAMPYRRWMRDCRSALLEPESRLDAALTVVMVAAIVLAVGAASVAVLGPPQGEQFSAVHLTTEDEDGEPLAADYPSTLEAGEAADLVVGVDNYEFRTVDYTVVVAEQRVESAADTDDARVVEQRELERLEPTLSHDESWHHAHEVEPTLAGEVRVVWLLYPDEVPDEPSIESASSHAHLWLEVADPDA